MRGEKSRARNLVGLSPLPGPDCRSAGGVTYPFVAIVGIGDGILARASLPVSCGSAAWHHSEFLQRVGVGVDEAGKGRECGRLEP